MIALRKGQFGFTLVELMVVVAIIVVLASLTVVSYGGMQERARDAVRKSDIATIAEALDLYYLKEGKYPNVGGSTVINSGWNTTADASWATFAAELQRITGEEIPKDPVNTQGVSIASSSQEGFGYAYYSSASSSNPYCGAGKNQMYLLLYRLESSEQTNTFIGDCPTRPLGPYSGASNYRVVR